MKSILVIDDEELLLKALDRFLKGQGYEVFSFSQWERGENLVRERPIDLLLVDLMLPNISGIEVFRRLREIRPNLICIVMTGFGTIPSAIEAIRTGAYHYVTKPFDLDDAGSLIAKALEHAQLKEENRSLRRQLQTRFGLENIIGQSPRMKEVFSLVEKIADTESTVLIEGESGTGKELLAKAIHCRSRRRDFPFVPVNCAAIPEGLLESELFGHVRGAFTGAVTTQAGSFETAHQGTIFLDEIGDMSSKLQVKLLRVLQERCFEPVGSHKAKEADIRVVAATNQDLEKAVSENRFREDLFYRLNVIPVVLPPLRKRMEDLPILIDHFLKKYNRQNQKDLAGFSEEALVRLRHHAWPGNVRELENLVERLVVMKGSGMVVPDDLPENLRSGSTAPFAEEVPFPEEGVSFHDLVESFELNLIRKALLKSEGNKNQAAQILHLNRTTLVEKMKRIMRDEK